MNKKREKTQRVANRQQRTRVKVTAEDEKRREEIPISIPQAQDFLFAGQHELPYCTLPTLEYSTAPTAGTCTILQPPGLLISGNRRRPRAPRLELPKSRSHRPSATNCKESGGGARKKKERPASHESQIGPNSGYQLPGTTSRRACYSDRGALS